MLPSSGAIAFRPSDASADTPHSCEMSAMPSDADAEPAPGLGQVRRVDAALARPVAQALDDVPARQQVRRVGDVGLRGQRVLLDVCADAVEQVAQTRAGA